MLGLGVWIGGLLLGNELASRAIASGIDPGLARAVKVILALEAVATLAALVLL